MKAAVLHEPQGVLTVENIAIDSPAPHELLIRTTAAGLCHSDLNHLRGLHDIPYPTVIGHESAGVVIAIGDNVEGFAEGDHVVTCLAAFCGKCDLCLGGRSYLCSGEHAPRAADSAPRLSQGSQEVHQFLNVSSFAEQLLVHESAAVKVTDDIPLDLAALLGCAVTTGLGAVFNKAQVRPGQSVAVIGCGGIGLSAIQGARLCGASQIVAIDLSADKLAVATMLGATHVVDASEEDTVERVHELTLGGADHCIEAAGSALTAAMALEVLRVGGAATIVGLLPGGKTFPVQGRLLLDDRRLQGSYLGSQNFKLAVPRYADMYLSGELLLKEMVSSRIGLDDINEGFEKMSAGNALRDLVLF